MLHAKWWSTSATIAGILLLSSCGGGYGGSTPAEPSPGSKVVQVKIVDFAFDPKQVSISAGDTVQWVLNSSTYTHTVSAEDGSFDSGMVFGRAGATFSQTFNRNNATFQYHCNTHWHSHAMQGSIKVGDGPAPKPGY